MRTDSFRRQRGIALFMAIFALLLVSAVAFGFMYLTNTETQVNSNYRSSQQAYFAARAGLEEARTRLRKGGDITGPTALPSNSGGVVYMVNPASGESIEPWDKNNTYADDSLCKTNYYDLNGAGSPLDYGTQGVPCDVTVSTQFPTGSNWGGSYNGVGTWQSQTALTSAVGNSSSYAGTMYFKWVRITLKANRTSSPKTSSGTYPFAVDPTKTSDSDPDNDKMVCWDGFEQLILPSGYTDCETPTFSTTNLYKPVYVLTAMAVTPEGSKRVITMEVANNPPVKTEGAINSQDYVTLNGQLTVDGYDYCTCSCSWVTNADKTKTYVCTDKQPLVKSCGDDKYAIYSNSGVDAPNKAETITAGTDPTIAQNQTKKTDIDYLINQYATRSDAVDATLDIPSGYPSDTTGYNLSCSAGDCGTVSGVDYGIPPLMDPLTEPNPVDNPLWGTQQYQITYVPGSLHISGTSKGNGVLIVNGDLVIDGGLQFYGLILVKGIVKFQGGGSTTTNIYGGVIAGESSVDNTVAGGSASIKYDLCALDNDNNPQPPSVLAMHELSY